MKIDIYKINKPNKYVFVEHGTSPESLKLPGNIEYSVWCICKNIEKTDKLIGINTNEVIEDILKNGYSVKSVKIIITTKLIK